MKTSSASIEERYLDALKDAEQKLASLKIVCGRQINLKGLRGWVFEQTVRTCLKEELGKRGLTTKIEEQRSIGGRATVDFLIGSVAIEVKAAGFFGDEGKRYGDYRKRVEERGWSYFYLTLQETHPPYVQVARDAFDKNRAFFLNGGKDEWIRFVAEVVRRLKSE